MTTKTKHAPRGKEPVRKLHGADVVLTVRGVATTPLDIQDCQFTPTPRRVFVCSAFSGAKSLNRGRAQAYCLDVLYDGDAPFAPHAFYTYFLDESPENRASGISAGISFLAACQEVRAYVVDGVVTAGMTAEIQHAISTGIPVRWYAATWTPQKALDGSAAELLELTPLPHLPGDIIPDSSQLLAPSTFAARTKAKFAEMERRLKAGEAYEDELEGLDDLLGTALPDRDRAAEADWEAEATRHQVEDCVE